MVVVHGNPRGIYLSYVLWYSVDVVENVELAECHGLRLAHG